MQSVRSRLTRSFAAGAILIGSLAALGGSPASAAPGDARAVGVGVDIDATIGVLPVVSVFGGLGVADAPPHQSFNVAGASIGVPATAAVTADLISATADSDSVGSSAESEVTGATLSVPAIDALIGGPILSTGTSVIRSAAVCDVGSLPTTEFDPIADLRVAGQPVVLDVNGEASVNVNAGPLGVGVVDIRTDVSETTVENASAVSIIAEVNIDVVGVGFVNGEVRIAETSCERLAVAPMNITSIDPDTGPVAGGQTVTITGEGFVAGESNVVVDLVAVPAADVTVIDGETITYITPAHAEGPVDVYVSSPLNSTSVVTYTYVDDGGVTGAPTITGINPDEGPVDGGTTVTVTGTDFVDGDTTVIIDGIVIPAADVTVIDGETLSFVTPLGNEGPVDVTVTTPAGESDALTYTYLDDGTAAPRLTGIDPDQGPIAGGTVVTLTGAYFVGNNTSVTIGGVTIPASEVTVNADNTTVTFTTPAHAEGPVDVTVTTTPGNTTAPQTFTYIGDDAGEAPAATNIAPDEGPTTGGTTVTVEGSGFVPGETTVTIGGVEIPADQVEVGGDGVTLTFVTPPHPEGPVEVTVTTPDGTTGPLTFTYLDEGVPGGETTITDIDPSEGPTEGGNTVTLTGTCFIDGGTTVTVDGEPVDVIGVNEDGTEIQFVTPPHAAGEVEVIATSTECGESNPVTFTYIAGETPEVPETPETTVPGPITPGPVDNGPAGPGYQPTSPYNAGDPSNPGTIARTGSETGLLVVGGLLSIMGGGALLMARRRLA